MIHQIAPSLCLVEYIIYLTANHDEVPFDELLRSFRIITYFKVIFYHVIKLNLHTQGKTKRAYLMSSWSIWPLFNYWLTDWFAFLRLSKSTKERSFLDLVDWLKAGLKDLAYSLSFHALIHTLKLTLELYHLMSHLKR